jgi:hypothetical protein
MEEGAEDAQCGRGRVLRFRQGGLCQGGEAVATKLFGHVRHMQAILAASNTHAVGSKRND